ncbi:hypothetical protein B0H17DRAFT_1205995 [Mycena rosella]|uniref:Uncharacterized protein n=1 Tax=Mycena rosella TaxID=1033263 RepID=A0AAD7D5Y7_MYCRO|nr:hypothetical protein B0H17DRAFT_1205995 [Mycena rosella]
MDFDVFVDDAQPGGVDASDDTKRIRGQDAEDQAQTLAIATLHALVRWITWRTGNPFIEAAHALRAHCVTLQTLRAGDPILGCRRRWLPRRRACPLPEALRPLHATTTSGMEGAKGMGRRNRKQLAWTGAREFAMRFVRERLYEGRYGEDKEEEGDPAWCVG